MNQPSAAPGAASSSRPQSVDPIGSIVQRQNDDGGWSYTRGASWTEPTLYAALVLKAVDAHHPAALKALHWIASRQLDDGGFAPCQSVEQSTWVTSLVLLFAPQDLPGGSYPRALAWVLRQTGQETSWMYRLKLRMNAQEDRAQASGWPWFPGAASWVSPTTSAISGLRHAQLYSRDQAIDRRIHEGQRFLITHTCSDGGWNHGSDRALGYKAESYPETTGAALVALRGVPREQLAASLACARSMARTCTSSEGASWLRMGLAAHGETVAPNPRPPKPRTTRDQCLQALAERVTEGSLQL